MTSSADDIEIPLLGGDVTEGLVRVGDTVRRPAGPNSTAIAAYLLHLEADGFAGSPRHLGIDSQGRDILTYLEGTTAGRPMEPWSVGPEVLVQIAELQRRLHDHSPLDLKLPAGAQFWAPVQIDGLPSAFDVADVIGHNDFTPENLIFRDQQLIGVIDFDLAGPTTRLLDVITTLMYWAPLRDPVDRDPLLRDADSGARMRLYATAYGLDPYARQRLFDVAVRRSKRSWHVMKHAAESRGGGWQRMWDEGVGDVILRTQDWLAANEGELRAKLGPAREDPATFAVYQPTARRIPLDNLAVREAAVGDVDACVELILDHHGGIQENWRSMFERTVAAEHQSLFVAEVGGVIAGYARIVLHEPPADAPESAAPAGYYLMGLVVGPGWRRRGVAEALTVARLTWAWPRTGRVFYFASASNPASLELHRKLGFVEVSRSFSFPGVEFADGSGVLCALEGPTG